MIDQVIIDQRCSLRRCCGVLGFRRQTYYRRKSGDRPEQRDAALIEVLKEHAERFVSWGFWKLFRYLRNQGLIKDNHKRVLRLYRQAGLHLRRPPRRKRLYRKYRDLLSPDGVNEGWAMDFVSDWVVGPNEKQVRIINIMDEGSRRALWTEAHRSISAKKLITILDRVAAYRGLPQYIRCDNGPEFIAEQLAAWAEEKGVELRHIQPGKPSQNGLIERLNKTLRTECLNLNWFSTMELLNEEIQNWSYIYNYLRPHESLKDITPDQYEINNRKFYYSLVTA